MTEPTSTKKSKQTPLPHKKQIRLLFENMLDGFAYCRMLYENDQPYDFIYLDVNAAFEQLTGLKNVVGKRVSQVIPALRESNPEVFEIYGRVALTGIPERFETFLPILNTWLSVSVYSTEKEYFYVTFDNITKYKHAESELEQRAIQLGLINNLSAQITSVLEIDRLLDQAAYLIHHTFNYHHVAIFLIEEGLLSLKAVAGSYTSYFQVGHSQQLDQGIIGRVVTSGQEVVANDVSLCPHYISLIAPHTVTCSELCIPLIIAGETVGVLDIQSPQLNGFSQNDVVAMEALAHQLAGAIANARLYEHAWQKISERRRIEAEISARNRELTLLNQIIAVSSGSRDIETILETTCYELGQAFNVAHVLATLLNEANNEVEVVADYLDRKTGSTASQEQGEVAAPEKRIPAEHWTPLAQYLLDQSGPLVAPEAQNDPRLASFREWLQRLGIVSLLGLPLCVEGKVLGSLILHTTQPHSFSNDEVTLAWSVADQVGGVLTRARLDQKRARAEAEVRAREEHFRQVVASVGDHIYLSESTAAGRHLNHYISPNVEQLTGYPPEKFMNDASFWPTVAIHPDDQGLAAQQLNRLRQGQNSEVEYRLIRADGQIIWVRDNGRPVLQADSVLIYGVVGDITARKETELALRQERALLAQRVAERTRELSAANAELARAARLKDEFLANMSHELRTPLNAILGLSESLLEQFRGPLNEYQLKWVKTIEQSGRHLLELINDILDLSKIEAGKLELQLETVSVIDLCQASLIFVREMAGKKKTQLSFRLDDWDLIFQADPRRLKQILINLLSNAVKFTPAGGQVSLEVTPNPAEGAIHFAVKDSGIGISAEDMSKLFKPFIQLDGGLSRQYEGTGLGLALVRKLVDLHGGSVTVASAGIPGQGSRFIASLPWSPTPDNAQTHEESNSLDSGSMPEATPGNRKGTILLAEDNEMSLEFLGDYLEHQGYHLVIARNGSEALERAVEIEPDLILMDIQMPILDGLQVTRHLRAYPRFATTPIVALTALAMPGDRERCLAAGTNEYLTKPVSLKGLIQVMDRLLPV